MPDFLAWQRPAVYGLATAPLIGARLAAQLPVTLHDEAGDVSASASFLLAGPGDVARFAPGQVIGRRPHPGCADAEATMMPHVELAAPDLPWRYSPQPHGDGLAAVRPWLVLVVGTPEEVRLRPDGRVDLAGGDLFQDHHLANSFRWAHVHETPGRTFSRILSPRPLETGVDYVAALVPGWRAETEPDGTITLVDAWTDDTAAIALPCFDSWSFRTTADPGDFASVSARLEPLSPEDAALLAARQFGRARVEVGPLRGTVLSAGAALTVVPDPGDPPVVDTLPVSVAGVVEPLCKELAVGDRWVLTLPRYDVPWYPGPVDGESWAWPPPGDDVVPDGWRRQLRIDPRHRGAAGLGTWIAIAWQDRIAEGAAAQAGAVAAAAQRIRHLVLGLRAAGGLWRRRVPSEPMARLATLSPLLGRMPVDGGGSVLQALAGRTPSLAPALLSSAARRMLRRRGPLDRSAAPGATSLAGLLEAANRCPGPQKPSPRDARLMEAVANPDRLRELAAGLRERAREVLTQLDDEHTAYPLAQSLETEGVAEALVDLARQDPPELDCRPLSDLDAFASSVAAGVDPTVARPVAVDRVAGALQGLREPVLSEPDVAPELDIPLWRFLADNAPDWLLPGAGDIPADRVLAVQSNPAFVDALLIGANEQTLGELRWRNLPITSRWTPLRRFWQRINIGRDEVATDIRPVVALDTDQPLWPDATDLGDTSHLADPTHGASLVVVLHTELFRRYPATVVYLTPNPDGAAVWGDVPNVDEPVVQREYPSFSGTLAPDLVFFGFGVPPSAGTDHWLVLEEPPPGYRFRRPAADASPDGAVFASTTFDNPVRVFLGNLL